ncbi:primase C-terminal domain-containing protein [Enterococcus gallinarum]|uniref:primase C-terminal domain-containing protein n=1 Tax=Enterococcus gallinarum TaxID=1353 RepID=UPI001F595FFA|nr:primase C-terminal domain-containing protein [Enterococcus gallinarum]
MVAFLDVVYSTILQNGIRKFKYKNSRLKPFTFSDKSGKGAIFAYRSKEHMIEGIGLVITSEEGIIENNNKFSHWTPNVYRYGTYADQGRQFTKGHSEDNLRQINTFFVDFDTLDPNFDYGEILLASHDLGFMPTMVLRTPHGYQAFYVLEKPAYITKKSNFKVINVAKMISKNLRDALAKDFPVDVNANHFGITRMPSEDNLLFFEPQYRYNFADWINWSMRMDADKSATYKNVFELPSNQDFRQVDEPWFRLLMCSEKIKGEKGRYGRNNVIFTLSLAYFSSGYEIEECELAMLEFNDRLVYPLTDRELTRIIRSAYSGKYQAAHREKIILLCQEWVDENLSEEQLFNKKKGWWKFKKERKMRKYSHSHEWAQDLLAYLNKQLYTYKPYIVSTKKELREELEIPERSLDKVMKQLKNENKIYYRVRSGRNGGITLASVYGLMRSIIRVKKEVQEAYFSAISEAFGLARTFIYATLEQLIEPPKKAEQIELFEVDTG